MILGSSRVTRGRFHHQQNQKQQCGDNGSTLSNEADFRKIEQRTQRDKKCVKNYFNLISEWKFFSFKSGNLIENLQFVISRISGLLVVNVLVIHWTYIIKEIDYKVFKIQTGFSHHNQSFY